MEARERPSLSQAAPVVVRTMELGTRLTCIHKTAKGELKIPGHQQGQRSPHVTVLPYSSFSTDLPYLEPVSPNQTKPNPYLDPASPPAPLITAFIPQIVSVGGFNRLASLLLTFRLSPRGKHFSCFKFFAHKMLK